MDRAETSVMPEEEGLAATGFGDTVEHRVRRIRFQSERSPAARVRVRYEYRDALVRLGVLPQTPDRLARRESSTGFAPAPYCPTP